MEKTVIELEPKTFMEHGLQAAARLRELGFREAAGQILLMNVRGALNELDVAFAKETWEHSEESTVRFYESLSKVDIEEPGIATKLAEKLDVPDTDVVHFFQPRCMPLTDVHRNNVREELKALLPITYKQVVTDTLAFDGLRTNTALALYRSSLYKTVFNKPPPKNPAEADVELENFHTTKLDLNLYAIVIAAAETVRSLEKNGLMYAQLPVAVDALLPSALTTANLTVQNVELLFEDIAPTRTVKLRLPEKLTVPDTTTALDFFSACGVAVNFDDEADKKRPLNYFLNLEDEDDAWLFSDGTLTVSHAERYTSAESTERPPATERVPELIKSGGTAATPAALPSQTVSITAGSMGTPSDSESESEEELDDL